jgi:hypothetical protein
MTQIWARLDGGMLVHEKQQSRPTPRATIALSRFPRRSCTTYTQPFDPESAQPTTSPRLNRRSGNQPSETRRKLEIEWATTTRRGGGTRRALDYERVRDDSPSRFKFRLRRRGASRDEGNCTRGLGITSPPSPTTTAHPAPYGYTRYGPAHQHQPGQPPAAPPRVPVVHSLPLLPGQQLGSARSSRPTSPAARPPVSPAP